MYLALESFVVLHKWATRPNNNPTGLINVGSRRDVAQWKSNWAVFDALVFSTVV